MDNHKACFILIYGQRMRWATINAIVHVLFFLFLKRETSYNGQIKFLHLIVFLECEGVSNFNHIKHKNHAKWGHMRRYICTL